ncbi:D-alanyl-D-alanine carboxypeptidase family protein [Tenuibacillus multivorans]|uniref:D-alanyl-D-alanine carboxypeptidase/D-alanyl-D-alanine carboxypeptidase (Penicillin-binding protein 5/6) n=1 Tax=Tenuibacillus multivorans TaxID=237069 RepID=A0A1H0CN67_9BACI|nr:D-alanyl-D-alanine carboxypeptidase family protein [Tenuibacillus multivorans]GEL76232.1 D-Ala-D-Ala carboxypeptidase [Tenuibacillus multivorans]SDN59283.1 D-alanyl-D-alanine carboxypeptidase/D-alanyl-D-alanine carboxypeptidase (penicillin-binding protein 5/6) [Tenuibacillus multivorans]
MKKVTTIVIICLIIFPNISHAQENIQYLGLNSESAILIDAMTGEVLYDKNSQQPMYPASLTKTVTAIVAIEEGDLNDTVTVSKKARSVDGTRVYLEAHEQVKLKKLVQGLLINSGNDAAVAIAEHMDGSVQAFTERMNRFAEENIGVHQSNFRNPHGLYQPKHVTTAEDMAKITQYAMSNDTFKEIAGTKQLTWDGKGWDTTLYNHHRLLRQRDDVTGVKNGYVIQAGFTLSTSATQEHINLIAITLNADSANRAYNDTEKLLEYGFNNFETYTVKPDQTFINDQGEKFILNHSLNFTGTKNANWTKEMNPNDELVIKGQNGEILLEHQLTPLKTVQTAAVSSSNSDSDLSQLNIWWIGLIALLTLKIFIYLFIRYKRRKSRFF